MTDKTSADAAALLPHHRHRELAVLQDLLQDMAARDTLRGRIDAWLALTRWLAGPPLWSEVYASGHQVIGHPLQRLAVLADVLDNHADLAAGVRASLHATLMASDATALFGEGGMPGHRGFWAELGERIGSRLLPEPRDDHNLARVLDRQFAHPHELELLEHMPADLFARLAQALLPMDDAALAQQMRQAFFDGFRLLAARVQAEGLAAPVRRRSQPGPVRLSPFHALAQASEELLDALVGAGDAATGGEADPQQVAARWQSRAQRCRDELAWVHEHLDSSGISVDVVFGMGVIECCLLRMEIMVALLLAQHPAERLQQAQRLLALLVRYNMQDRSIRHLLRTNLNLLQRKVVDSAGQTGEHYIAQSPSEYRHIWLAAAGGGLLMVFTAAGKFLLHEWHLAPFFDALFNGLNYTLAFLVLQHLGLLLATKQPAMTAAALANVLRSHDSRHRLERVADTITRIVHSQIAAALGNIIAVVVGAIVFATAWTALAGHPLVDEQFAVDTLQSFNPLSSGTVFYAALTGVILFVASVLGGWIANWATYHRLPLAMAEHPLGERFGRARMERLGQFVDRHLSGWATCVALGLMLGFAPVLGAFLGLPVDVRHVTISSGKLALSALSLQGDGIPVTPLVLWGLAGVACMFVLNLTVSFGLSLYTAMRAFDLPRSDMLALARVLGQRLRRRPLDFIRPSSSMYDNF
ncbi:hypothetical protein [Amphibiibacter pelophylacis]|uniref:Uncharacterized protein n=1 Tax=Amphibiibacter pelophylacis TaxID=1799477 RepID=A0ACC6P042_9BURK